MNTDCMVSLIEFYHKQTHAFTNIHTHAQQKCNIIKTDELHFIDDVLQTFQELVKKSI